MKGKRAKLVSHCELWTRIHCKTSPLFSLCLVNYSRFSLSLAQTCPKKQRQCVDSRAWQLPSSSCLVCENVMFSNFWNNSFINSSLPAVWIKSKMRFNPKKFNFGYHGSAERRDEKMLKGEVRTWRGEKLMVKWVRLNCKLRILMSCWAKLFYANARKMKIVNWIAFKF